MPHSRHVLAAVALLAASALATVVRSEPSGRVVPTAPRSGDWLALLPDGEEKRRFIADCTGCHVFDERITRPNGRARTEDEWRAAVTRMLGYAGATTSFPVISSGRDPARTAAWLASSLASRSPVRAATPSPARARVDEFPMPEPNDLPHDVAVDALGRVVITGMLSHRMYVLDPRTRAMQAVEIPVEKANPRALEIASDGAWWLVLGAPHKLARYAPAEGANGWRIFDAGTYAHSLAIAKDGAVWFNGHFSRDPEIVGRIDAASGAVRTMNLPPHPTLATDPGGPVPYEIRIAPDGGVWVSELQGDRVIRFDPTTNSSKVFALPIAQAGVRRLDVGADGIVWLPAYAANALLELDPASGRVSTHLLPMRDTEPYVARVHPTTGEVWLGTGSADAVFVFDPRKKSWRTYDLPTHGALVRHLAFDRLRGGVWLAYGAAPGIPARIAHLAPE